MTRSFVSAAKVEKSEVKNDFTRGSIPKVILTMAVPMTAAQLVSVLYNMVDRMFLGHMPDLGTLALTGLGLSTPIVTLVLAFANLCGMGGGPLCSIARGAGEKEKAERYMAQSLTLLLILGVALTVLLEAFMEPLLLLFGASEETLPYAEAYLHIYLLGTVPIMISLGMHSFINAQGFARMSMLTTGLGAVINIILDPIFIFAFGMGIRGAAIATVISQCASAVYVMAFLCSSRAALDLRLRYMVLQAKMVGEILAMGISSFVMNVTASLVQIACNVQLKSYGGDLYVGVMTVLNSVQQVFFLLMNGLSAAAQPVLGFNYGAKTYGRVMQGIRFLFVVLMIYAAVVEACILAFPGAFIRIFNNDPELVAAARPALRIYFCTFACMGFQFTGQTTFQSLGRSGKAVFFSLLRKAFIVVPLTFLLPGIGGLGVTGVYLAECISCCVGGVACCTTMMLTEYRKMQKELSPESVKG